MDSLGSYMDILLKSYVHAIESYVLTDLLEGYKNFGITYKAMDSCIQRWSHGSCWCYELV